MANSKVVPLLLIGGGAALIYIATKAKAQPAVPTEDALATIMTQLDTAWVYRGTKWLMYDPQDLIGSDLTEIREGENVWLDVTTDCNLTYKSNSYPLLAGWNTIIWKTT